MKTLSSHIKEALIKKDTKISKKLEVMDIYKVYDELIRHLDYSKLKETNNQDPNQFEISKENEQLFIDSFANCNTEYTALSTQDYYTLLNKNSKWENLSSKEKNNFYTENGNIVIIDGNNNPLYFIDIEISSRSVGNISLGSLVNFKNDGYYICISKINKFAKFISHKELVNIVKKDQKKY